MPPSITQAEPWQFTIAVPGWLASMNGTIGVRGINADIDVPVDGSSATPRHDFRDAGGGAKRSIRNIRRSNLHGSFRRHADKRPDQQHPRTGGSNLVDGALSWRLINQPRGSLDFAAGTTTPTYTNDSNYIPTRSRLNRRANNSLTTLAMICEHRLNKDISNSQFLATLKSTIEADIVSEIDKHNSLDRHQRKPNIPIGPLGGRIEQDTAQRVREFYCEGKGRLCEARVDALVARGVARRDAVDRALNAAKARIANQLALRLDKSLSQTLQKTITGSILMWGCVADIILIKRFTRPYAARSEDSESVQT